MKIRPVVGKRLLGPDLGQHIGKLEPHAGGYRRDRSRKVSIDTDSPCGRGDIHSKHPAKATGVAGRAQAAAR